MWFSCILESEAVNDCGTFADAKQYRKWSKKMKNVVAHARPRSREELDAIETLNEDEINDAFRQGTFGNLKDVSA